MIILIACVLGVGAAGLLIVTGYLFGARSGYSSRQLLRAQNDVNTQKVYLTREELAYHKGSAEGLKNGTSATFDVLSRQADTLQQMVTEMVGPLVRRDKEVEDLRLVVEDVLKPLTKRTQLALDLSDVKIGAGRRNDLSRLLDQIAEKGQFEAVLLSDDNGLPLSASSNARDLDRLAATSSMVLLFADRIGRDNMPTPLSLMVHDEENKETLCRIFNVGGQRMLLTAVSRGMNLTPTTLDSTLSKVDSVLLPAGQEQ